MAVEADLLTLQCLTDKTAGSAFQATYQQAALLTAKHNLLRCAKRTFMICLKLFDSCLTGFWWEDGAAGPA
jgi:hypothetical protein